MRILIANDDGFLAPGLLALVDACEGLGELDVVAPEQNASGTSNSLTLEPAAVVHSRGQRFSLPQRHAVRLRAHRAHRPARAPPRPGRLGINNGPNMGDDTLYSGTVAAAMEGFLFGIPSIAFSQVKGWAHLDAASRVARSVIERVLAEPPAERLAAQRQHPEPRRCRCAAARGDAPRPPPCERAGDLPEQSARRTDVLDRRRGRCARGRRRAPISSPRPRGASRSRRCRSI